MNLNPAINERDNVVNLQERRLDRTVLRTYRTKADIDDIVPNEKQPRMGPKVDEELQRQIEANGGLFEPLLVEPHPNLPGKLRIIDGDRRWTNSRVLVEQGKEEYRQIPVEVTDRTLSEKIAFGSGYTSIVSARSGTPKKKKWWRTGSWTLWDGRALQIFWASPFGSWTSSLTFSSSPRNSPPFAIRVPPLRGHGN